MQTRQPVISSKAMVCTAHPEATRVGIDILHAGGNAIDAAIAANAALGVVEPMMCGVGGDLMAMVWCGKSQHLHGYNGSGRAPAALTLERFRKRGLSRIPVHDPLTWTVPGCVEGWASLLERFGTRPLDEVLRPAIRLAEDGCPVPPIIAGKWAESASGLWGDGPRVYLPGGQAPREGEVFRNPDLARVYRRIGENWRDFYEGEVASQIAGFCRTHGGLIEESDLSRHGGELLPWVPPSVVSEVIRLSNDPAARQWMEAQGLGVPLPRRGMTEDRFRGEFFQSGRFVGSAAYRAVDVFALPPNTHGLCVLQMLAMLEGEDLARIGFGSAETLHRMVEAKKLSFEDRARWIADPAVEKLPIARLISKEHARTRWGRFCTERAMQTIPDDMPAGSDTTYLCAADEQGNAISLIQSIYHSWGSGAVPEGLGFCLQNRGLGFSLDPDHPCRVEPGKRPLHTIIPGFAMREGKPWLCFGVMGGTMQPQGQVQILTNIIDHGMDVQQAGEAPRWRHEGSSDVDGTVMRDGGVVHVEPGFPDESLAALQAKGHRISHERVSFGGYQAIMFDHARGVMLGGSDPRKDGCAMGL